MDTLLQALLTAAVSFAATNIDDIFVLMLFFGQKSKPLDARHVVVGQYLGFSALVTISLIGYFARYVAPREWIGLLGLLPVAIGVRKLIESWKAKGDVAHEAPEVKPAAAGTASSVLTVAAVTFANGGDNIGIYTPLFAASDLARLLVTLVVFFVLLGVWCVAGYYLGGHPLVAKTLDRYGHIIVPFVLIGLGLYIIYESGTLALVWAVG
jgi:cadmium resistance transport/sequestration family protein